MIRLIAFAVLSLSLAACSTVKPYQRAYLNDDLMKSGSLESEAFEQSVFQYRESAIITGAKKGKGGCGCN